MKLYINTIILKTYRIQLTVILLFLTIFCHALQANQFNSWWYYYGKHRVSDKVSIQTLYSWSRSDFVKDGQQSLMRTGINYHYHKNIELGAGYDWVILFPYGEQPVPQKKPEHRIFEQFILKQNISEFSIKHTFRLEQQFRKTGMSQRARYQFSVKHPIIKSVNGSSIMDIKFSNEALLSVGKNNKGHYFGQNRLWINLDFPLKNGIIFSPGYMNQYIVKRNRQVENNHTLMMGLTYNFDFRKK